MCLQDFFIYGKSYGDNYREFISSVFMKSDYPSFLIIRSAEFKQISQVQEKFLIMLSLSVNIKNSLG